LPPPHPSLHPFPTRRSSDLPYDMAHANFFMSGLVAAHLKHTLGIPFVITFHALGEVRRLAQGAADTFPPARLRIEHSLMRSADRSEEHTSELQSRFDLVCRL